MRVTAVKVENTEDVEVEGEEPTSEDGGQENEKN